MIFAFIAIFSMQERRHYDDVPRVQAQLVPAAEHPPEVASKWSASSPCSPSDSTLCLARSRITTATKLATGKEVRDKLRPVVSSLESMSPKHRPKAGLLWPRCL